MTLVRLGGQPTPEENPAVVVVPGPTNVFVNVGEEEVADNSQVIVINESVGLAGAQGLTGAQGPIGLQGVQGTQGTQGVQGDIGPVGAQGIQGVQGFEGIQGFTGTQGAQGTQGTDGAQGTQGVQGKEGTQGLTGAGVQGSQGTTGLQGTQGTQGLQGLQGKDGAQGAGGALAHYGSFYDTDDQIANTANTGYPMRLNATAEANGVVITNDANSQPTKINFTYGGTYNIQFSAQITTSSSSTDELQVWLAINGTYVPESNTQLTLSGTGKADVAGWNWVTSLNAEDFVQIFWAVTDTRVKINGSLAGLDGGPNVPSLIVTATQVMYTVQGTQGLQGITGIQGALGLQGAAGADGVAGEAGAQGIQGIQGYGAQGTQGVQGTQGIVGSGLYTYSETAPESPDVGDRWFNLLNGKEYTWVYDGDSSQWVDTRTSGYYGPVGEQGIQGIQGATGSQGTVGIQGALGTSFHLLGHVLTVSDLDLIENPQENDAYIVEANSHLYVYDDSSSIWIDAGNITGPQGTTGSQGIQGFDGIQGPQGPQGLQGLQGTEGTQGAVGLQGAQGTQGTLGAQGATGATGTQGVFGIQGIQGSTGIQGVQGTQGIQGTSVQGVVGAQGVQGLIGTTGSLTGYYAFITDTTTQTASSANTAYAISLNNLNSANGITLSGTPQTRINFVNAGTYQIVANMQFDNSDAASDNAYTWLKKNGTNLSNSTYIAAIVSKHGATNGNSLITWVQVVTVAANDYIEIFWQAQNTTVRLLTTAAAGNYPQAPSVNLVIRQLA